MTLRVKVATATVAAAGTTVVAYFFWRGLDPFIDDSSVIKTSHKPTYYKGVDMSQPSYVYGCFSEEHHARDEHNPPWIVLPGYREVTATLHGVANSLVDRVRRYDTVDALETAVGCLRVIQELFRMRP